MANAGFINKLQLTTTAPTVVSTTLNYTGPSAVGFPSKYLASTAPPTSGLNGNWKYERLPGTYASGLTSVNITGTGGQFSCTGVANIYLRVGQQLTISGTLAGTGTITGYTTPTIYLISATNGSTTFTLTTAAGAAIVTTAGTPTGLTYALTDYLMTNVLIASTDGQFSCGQNFLRVGQYLRVSGTSSGTGSVVAGDYSISATNGSTTFTVVNQNTGFTPATTVAGTTTGLTFTILDRMNFNAFNPYYPTILTGAPVSYPADKPKIKKKNLKTLWAVITPHHTLTILPGAGYTYLFFQIYTFDNEKGSPLYYTNRFDYSAPKVVENFSNEAAIVLHAGCKYLLYAKDSGKYVANQAAVDTPGFALSSYPGQLATEMLKDPYDIYTDIPHIPFNQNLVVSPYARVFRITGTDGTFNCVPLNIAGGSTSYLSNGQRIVITGGTFTGGAGGTIVYPPHLGGNSYFVDGAPVTEVNGTITFKLKTIMNEPLVTTITAPTSLTSVVIAGTAGQFACASQLLLVGQTLQISGTLSGTGGINGYTNPTMYQVSATNGSTTFTLTTIAGEAIATTAGTTAGLSFSTWNAGSNNRFYVNPADVNDMYVTQANLTTTTTNSTNLPISITVHSMGYSGTADDSSEVNVKLDLVY